MPNPNETELAILKHLWVQGDQSAREIHNGVSAQFGWKSSTTRTLISRMETKGWIERKDMHGLAVYAAKLDRVETLGSIVRTLARKVLDIDGHLPASLFTESPHLSDDDLDALDAIINAAEAEDET
ncbi:MAG: BlaI/MecI/CopY family transcriptional regulator [Pseudomonadota bacterium]